MNSPRRRSAVLAFLLAAGVLAPARAADETSHARQHRVTAALRGLIPASDLKDHGRRMAAGDLRVESMSVIENGDVSIYLNCRLYAKESGPRQSGADASFTLAPVIAIGPVGKAALAQRGLLFGGSPATGAILVDKAGFETSDPAETAVDRLQRVRITKDDLLQAVRALYAELAKKEREEDAGRLLESVGRSLR
ncbi:MAG: hypothetical protein HYZ75_09955 [Elusimicrobia bacterium]|nr:hypothetical protein [Elusimicrobiota bacterium]